MSHSHNDPVTEADVERIAELAIRRYFDIYLRDVFPLQVAALIERHNLSPKAHGGVERRFNKLIWMAIGASAFGGAGVGWGVQTLIGL